MEIGVAAAEEELVAVGKAVPMRPRKSKTNGNLTRSAELLHGDEVDGDVDGGGDDVVDDVEDVGVEGGRDDDEAE